MKTILKLTFDDADGQQSFWVLDESIVKSVSKPADSHFVGCRLVCLDLDFPVLIDQGGMISVIPRAACEIDFLNDESNQKNALPEFLREKTLH